MGLEARCVGRRGAASGEGRLQWEGDRLLFRSEAWRGDWRAAEWMAVAAEGDELVVRFGPGKPTAHFALGSAALAAKWADKILHPPTLLDKLGISKDGELRIALRGEFGADFTALLAGRVSKARTNLDVLLWCFDDPAELAELPKLAAMLAPAGAVWMVYPKGATSPVKETAVREAGRAAGLVDNKTCSFSAALTALRWVHPRARR
ncbi:MAG: DUF3052 family protein [Bryobacterales bacterium]|nr:DUF3052 family protein [Bryobacterales bacterium]